MHLVFVSDDIAGQKSLLLSPRRWQRHLQPRLERWCDLIHAHGLRGFYHTDGAARALIKPILDRSIDNQSILPRGTVDQVRAEVKNCLRTLAPDTKAIFAPHVTTSSLQGRLRISPPWSKLSCNPGITYHEAPHHRYISAFPFMVIPDCVCSE